MENKNKIRGKLFKTNILDTYIHFIHGNSFVNLKEFWYFIKVEQKWPPSGAL